MKILQMCIPWVLLLLLLSTPASADVLSGELGSSERWGSGWIDLSPPMNFQKGDKFRLQIGGSAKKIVVRLLRRGQDPNTTSGIIGGAQEVPPNRVVVITLPEDYPNIVQISVHGGPKPWHYGLGSANGAATLDVAEVYRLQ